MHRYELSLPMHEGSVHNRHISSSSNGHHQQLHRRGKYDEFAIAVDFCLGRRKRNFGAKLKMKDEAKTKKKKTTTTTKKKKTTAFKAPSSSSSSADGGGKLQIEGNGHVCGDECDFWEADNGNDHNRIYERDDVLASLQACPALGDESSLNSFDDPADPIPGRNCKQTNKRPTTETVNKKGGQ